MAKRVKLNIDLPSPICKLGYPEEQVRSILGARYNEFMSWMYGQTMSSCDGRIYNHDKKEWEPDFCGPHGPIVYVQDLLRFLEGLPIID